MEEEKHTEEKDKTENTKKKELEKCEKQKEEYLAGWQRARADFLNYKKEEMERIGGIVFYAQEGMILKILPILDNFDLIEKKLPQELKDDHNIEGMLQIKNHFHDFLKNYGIEEMKVLGEKFDPNFHEAVEQIEIKDKEKGIIVEEVQKGYLIQGKVLRAARVKVSK
ncbi:nucleotide exchange factor GrpE [Candidatus Parcubacteria bacterium]|nr:nucleotide exchange factor GrpE [Candidatus Parcubacteria bacterium]